MIQPNISVVVPLYNEEESLEELCSWIDKVMQANGYTYEVLLMDDGSDDDSWAVVQHISQTNPHIKGIKFRRNYGKSAALNTGFQAALGDVVITMDADLQDSPDEIPELYRMITEEGFDLVSGWKKKRYDPLSKTIPTKIYNWFTRRVSGIHLHDFNCGLKAYKNRVVKSVEVYGEMHRYIPVLAKWAGFKKIGEKVVQHRARKHGVTKFGLERFIRGPLDLLSVVVVTKFGKRPMHLFGVIGSIVFLVGLLAAIYIGGNKLYYLTIGEKAPLVTDSPYFYISLVSMILGTQLFLAGFLAELIARSGADRNKYLIETKIGVE